MIGLAAIGLGAQSPTPSQGQPPKFRSDTRLVRISVVVHDRRNQPAGGLTAGDFRLFDRGTEQAIALFDVERRTLAPDAAGAGARAVDESQLLHVLGYYPPSGSWDRKFHEIKVTTRRPGLDVRHRTGYLALPSRPGRQAG